MPIRMINSDIDNMCTQPRVFIQHKDGNRVPTRGARIAVGFSLGRGDGVGSPKRYCLRHGTCPKPSGRGLQCMPPVALLLYR